MKRELLMHVINNRFSCFKKEDSDELFYSLQYAWDIVVTKPEGAIVDLPNRLLNIVMNTNSTPD